MKLTQPLLCLAVLCLVSGCVPLRPGSCANQSAEYVLQLDPIMARWEMVMAEAGADAGSSVPTAPSVTLADLQRLGDDLAALDPPDCAELLQLAASKLILQSQRTYQAVADGVADDVVAAERQRLTARYQQYVTQRKALGNE